MGAGIMRLRDKGNDADEAYSGYCDHTGG